MAIGLLVGATFALAITGLIYSVSHRMLLLGIASVALNIALVGTLCALLMAPGNWLRATRAKVDIEQTHIARLALAGEISASIIHEVIRPLSSILVNIEALELRLVQQGNDTSDVRDILHDLKRDRSRANDIALRLRRFLSKRELHLEPTDINQMVAHAVELLQTDIKNGRVVAQVHLTPGTLSVVGDPVHLQQVLITLIINAIEAMAQTPTESRQLEISTNRVTQQRVAVIVSDTGPKMTAHQHAHAFEPFFTTKDSGMGLGLSMARAIVLAHQGVIWIDRDAANTSFHFEIPITQIT